MRRWSNWAVVPMLLMAVAVINICGCGSGQLPMAPAEGKVLYRGQPLKCGNVMFQPKVGPPAQGKIQPDGTFVLSTQDRGEGAVLGDHRVSITCNEAHMSQVDGAAPVAREAGVGRSLIPRKYSVLASSGLTAKVEKANEPFVFDLK